MATTIHMKHKDSGITKNGFYGYSWTTLFFGSFPALFRADFVTFIGSFIVLVILAIATSGFGTILAMIVWSFMYNSYYTKGLLESGYKFSGTLSENKEAAQALGVSLPDSVSTDSEGARFSGDLDLRSDAYIIYLTKTYKIEKNDALGKIICADRLFNNVDEALSFADTLESKKR